MTAKQVQYLLALIFIGLGGWCLVAPLSVEVLVLKPEYRELSPTSQLLMGCFGAQAVLCGIVIATAEFKPRTFLIFGLAGSLPFFVFNVYFYYFAEMFTSWMLLDFAGNLGILACGIVGYQLKQNELATV